MSNRQQRVNPSKTFSSRFIQVGNIFFSSILRGGQCDIQEVFMMQTLPSPFAKLNTPTPKRRSQENTVKISNGGVKD